MTVEEMAAVIAKEVVICLEFNGSEWNYSKGDPLHQSAFGNMVIDFIQPETEDKILVALKGTIERSIK